MAITDVVGFEAGSHIPHCWYSYPIRTCYFHIATILYWWINSLGTEHIIDNYEQSNIAWYLPCSSVTLESADKMRDQMFGCSFILKPPPPPAWRYLCAIGKTALTKEQMDTNVTIEMFRKQLGYVSVYQDPWLLTWKVLFFNKGISVENCWIKIHQEAWHNPISPQFGFFIAWEVLKESRNVLYCGLCPKPLFLYMI